MQYKRIMFISPIANKLECHTKFSVILQVLLVDAMGMVSGTGTIIDPHVVVTAAQHFDG